MNVRFISIQSTYSSASLSLFFDNICIETVSINDTRASSHLIPYLENLLNKHTLTLADIAFIAIDQGPGAFTSLRVSIATVNGIAFGKRVPLLGVDGLDALGHEMFNLYPGVDFLYVSMLNAYNDDVYFALHDVHNQQLATIEKGCEKIEALLEDLNSLDGAKILIFAGNGASLHRDMIMNILGDRVQFVQPLINTASSINIGALAYAAYQNAAKITFKIEPSYMKTQYFAVKNTIQ